MKSKKTNTTVVTAKIERTSMGLKNALFEELDMLRSGRATPARSNAFAKSTSQIVAIARLEFDAKKLALSLSGKNKTVSLDQIPLGTK